MDLSLSLLLPLLFLMVAVIDDLAFKKFHNWLFIVLTLIGSLYVVMAQPIEPLQAFGGFVVGGLLMLPLVLMGATGAGDMKFMMSFGVLMGTLSTFEIFVYALFWGALIGVFQAILAGKTKILVNNMFGFLYKLRPKNPSKIPYTVAILFGWATWKQVGGIL